MSDADLRRLFATTTLHGRSVPSDAELSIEQYDTCTEVLAALHIRGRRENFGYRVSHLVAIRADGASPFQDEREVAAQVRQAVIALAYACIDAIPPQRVRAAHPNGPRRMTA